MEKLVVKPLIVPNIPKHFVNRLSIHQVIAVNGTLQQMLAETFNAVRPVLHLIVILNVMPFQQDASLQVLDALLNPYHNVPRIQEQI